MDKQIFRSTKDIREVTVNTKVWMFDLDETILFADNVCNEFRLQFH